MEPAVRILVTLQLCVSIRTANISWRDTASHGAGQPFALPIKSGHPSLCTECHTRIDKRLIYVVNCSVIYLNMLYPSNLHNNLMSPLISKENNSQINMELYSITISMWRCETWQCSKFRYILNTGVHAFSRS